MQSSEWMAECQQWLDALAAGAVIATANARLARSLAADYERHALNSGRAVWPTPTVLPLSSWLTQRYQAAALAGPEPPPRLLSSAQEEQVWAAIIRADSPLLLRVEAAARRARESWRLLRYWELDPADPVFANHEDSAAFARWTRTFRAWLDDHEAASEAELPALLTAWVAAGSLAVPGRLLLAGFYDREPAVERMLDALRAAGCEACWAERPGAEGVVLRCAAENPRQEVAAALRWARNRLEVVPTARIGIVVPDLAGRLPLFERLLPATLDPPAQAPGARPAPRPYNVSLGRPLARQPLIAAALHLLSLVRRPSDAATIGALLASPHWGLPADAEDRRAALARRALLDARLRRRGDAVLQVSDLRKLARETDAEGRPRAWQCPALAARLDRLLDAARELPGRADTAGWAAAFAAWLKTAGWPEGRPLDSIEYQAWQAWQDLLSRFNGLADFAGALTRAEALALLRRLAAQQLFQPRAGDAPVQVLGLHEANGQHFDHLWVMALDDTAWPPAPRPDSFIPLALQRQLGMPGSEPGRQRRWAEAITARFAAAAPEVVFSHARQSASGTEELACSPLIAAWPGARLDEVAPGEADGWVRRIRESAQAEPAPATAPVPFAGAGVSGGSRVFANQAACPFRAFAEHRLGARPLDRLQLGLGPMRRGTLVHEVLERVWRVLGDHAGLLARDKGALRQLVGEQVAASLQEVARGASPATLTERYTALEAGRVEDKVMDWLALERDRAPFRVVGFEQWAPFEVGGLRVNLKLDRVDELEDGSRVVLDYKTGKVKPSGWFGDRPDDPQLPLYSVAVRQGALSEGATAPAEVAAVAFAQVRPDTMRFSGVVRGEGLLPDLPPARGGELKTAAEEWPAVLDAWAGVLERLAAGFRAGEAGVDPKDGLRTCENTYCELQALCRINERLPGSGDGADDEAEVADE